MKKSKLRELILEELASDNGYNKAWKDQEAALDKPRPDYKNYSKDMERDARGEDVDLEKNVPPSEDEVTPDRKTAVLMQKFGHDPLYKAIIDADNKEASVKALNKLTKERGFNAALHFLNYYKRLDAASNSAAV